MVLLVAASTRRRTRLLSVGPSARAAERRTSNHVW
jgi:hypothetical protein